MNETLLMLKALFPDGVDFYQVNELWNTEYVAPELWGANLISSHDAENNQQVAFIKTSETVIELEPITENEDLWAGISPITKRVYFLEIRR